ncbi:hypothetical protein Tco_0359768 [Tanacetum coccineum]
MCLSRGYFYGPWIIYGIQGKFEGIWPMVVLEVYGFTCSVKYGAEKKENNSKGLVLDVELLDRVFKVPITTVKCIPHGCRLAFSQTLKTVLCKLVAQPDSVNAWVSYTLKSLATQGKDDGITTLVKSILDGSALGSFGQGEGDFLEEGATGNTNIKQCLRKVTDGHFMTVVKVLSSSGVAPYYDDTIKTLEAKHPYKPPSSMPNITFSEPPLV